MSGTYITFPNVPAYPGVPELVRPIQQQIGENVPLSIALGTVESFLINALQQAPKWGIYDAKTGKDRLGVGSNDTSTGGGLLQSIISQAVGGGPPVLTTAAFEYQRENRIATFQVEEGSFAAYNKVQNPASTIVTMVLEGDVGARSAFLAALEDACNSTDLFDVYTPEALYHNYNIVRYTYARKAQRGLTLLIAEVYLEEVRQVSAAFTQAIVAPIPPEATVQESSGITQAVAPNNSVLLDSANGATKLYTKYIVPLLNGGNQ